MPGRVNIGKNTHQWARKDSIALHKIAGGTRVGERLRQELANPDIARKAAKAATTRAINRGWTVPGKGPSFSPSEAENLKEGVMGMASRIAPGDNLMMYKLQQMDADKLSQLYANNKFVFEVFFNYGGIEKGPIAGTFQVSQEKSEDAYFLIEQYERAYGKIL